MKASGTRVGFNKSSPIYFDVCERLQIEDPVILSAVLCEDTDTRFHGKTAEMGILP